jgi:hypothetical protein
MSASTAATSPMKFSALTIFSSHARTWAKSGAYGEVIDGGVGIVGK